MPSPNLASVCRSKLDAAWQYAQRDHGDTVLFRCPTVRNVLCRIDALGFSLSGFLTHLLRPTADEADFASERRNNQRWRESVLVRLLSHSVNVPQRELLMQVLRAQRGDDLKLPAQPVRDIGRKEMKEKVCQRWSELLARFPSSVVPTALSKEVKLSVWQSWHCGLSVPNLEEVGVACVALGIGHDDAWRVFDPETYGVVSTEAGERSRRRTHRNFLRGWPKEVSGDVMSPAKVQAKRIETRAIRRVEAAAFLAELRDSETRKALEAAGVAESSRCDGEAAGDGASVEAPQTVCQFTSMEAPFSLSDLLDEISPIARSAS